jgi:hypothetical protein
MCESIAPLVAITIMKFVYGLYRIRTRSIQHFWIGSVSIEYRHRACASSPSCAFVRSAPVFHVEFDIYTNRAHLECLTHHTAHHQSVPIDVRQAGRLVKDTQHLKVLLQVRRTHR